MKIHLFSRISCACLLASAMGLSAGPLKRADVAGQPAWLLHIDFDALRPTTLGKLILAEMEKPDVQSKLEAFQSVASVDLRTQLHGATIYGAAASPEAAVLMLYADFDSDRLVSLAQAAQDSQETKHKDHTVYNWLDDKKKAKNGVRPRIYAAIHGKRVLFGQREESVATALDVLDGTAANLGASKEFPQLGAAGDKSFISAAVRKLDLPSEDPNAAVLKMAKLLRLQIGESDGKLKAALTVEANDADVATQIASIGNGLMSLLKLQKDKPESAKLAEALALKQDGAQVVVNLAMPAADAVEMIKADAARKAAKKEKAKEE